MNEYSFQEMNNISTEFSNVLNEHEEKISELTSLSDNIKTSVNDNE